MGARPWKGCPHCTKWWGLSRAPAPCLKKIDPRITYTGQSHARRCVETKEPRGWGGSRKKKSEVKRFSLCALPAPRQHLSTNGKLFGVKSINGNVVESEIVWSCLPCAAPPASNGDIPKGGILRFERVRDSAGAVYTYIFLVAVVSDTGIWPVVGTLPRMWQ